MQRTKKGSSDEEQLLNADNFDEYAAICCWCTDAVKDQTSAEVNLEARTMIPKMQRLLDPSMKSKGDYDEATKYGGNILAKWPKGHVDGKRTCIPDIYFWDKCYAALKIFSCAVNEAKYIPLEFVKMFG